MTATSASEPYIHTGARHDKAGQAKRAVIPDGKE
jgi:hypothetical protein